MKKATIIALSIIFLMSGICSCTRKIYETQYVPVPSSSKEVIHERVQYVDVPLPETKKINLSVDSSSFLEDNYYTSTARINTDGTLYHDLISKNDAKVTGTVVVSDTLRNDTINTPYPVPGPTKYINELTTWQKICVYGFNSLIGGLVVSVLLWLLKKKFSL